MGNGELINQMFKALAEERKNALEDAALACEQRLIENLSWYGADPHAYNRAIRDCARAIRDLTQDEQSGG